MSHGKELMYQIWYVVMFRIFYCVL